MAGGHAFSQVGGAGLVTTPFVRLCKLSRNNLVPIEGFVHTMPAPSLILPWTNHLLHVHCPYYCLTCALVHCANIYITLVLMHSLCDACIPVWGQEVGSCSSAHALHVSEDTQCTCQLGACPMDADTIVSYPTLFISCNFIPCLPMSGKDWTQNHCTLLF